MAKTRSKSQAGLYTSYKNSNKHAANRKRKLLKLQKLQPNNEQITKALANIKYRRYTPKVQHWSHSAIAAVMIKKSFEKGRNSGIPLIKVSENDMFKLKARAHMNGVLVWNT